MRTRTLAVAMAVLMAVPVGLAQASEEQKHAEGPGDSSKFERVLAEFDSARREFQEQSLADGASPRARQANGSVSPLEAMEVSRIGGVNRYDTAAQLSLYANDAYRWWFDEDFPIVFLATGLNYPDALAAGAVQAPILLTAKDSVPVETMQALQEIDPQIVFIVGGTSAVSTQVENHVFANISGDVVRISGSDRYSTAAAISEAFWESGIGGTVYLATGQNFPDALAAGPAAGYDWAPMLLTGRDALPAATAAELDRLDPDRVVVVGGTGAVSDAVLAEAAQYARLGAERRSGADRYETAVSVGGPVFTFENVLEVILATGTNYPDALAAGPAAYWWDGPVLLMRPTCAPYVVQDRIAELEPWYLTIAGGTSAIAEGAIDRTC